MTLSYLLYKDLYIYIRTGIHTLRGRTVWRLLFHLLTALGAVGATQLQPNANPMGRRHSTMEQHDAGCCVAGSEFPASTLLDGLKLIFQSVCGSQRCMSHNSTPIPSALALWSSPVMLSGSATSEVRTHFSGSSHCNDL